MDKVLLILFVALGVVALILGCLLMRSITNDIEKFEESESAADFVGQVYSAVEPLRTAVTEQHPKFSGVMLAVRAAEVA